MGPGDGVFVEVPATRSSFGSIPLSISRSLSLSPGAPIISDCLSTSLIHLSFWGTSCRQRARLRGRGWELGGGGEVKLILDYRWRRTNRGPRATRLRMGTSTLHRQ